MCWTPYATEADERQYVWRHSANTLWKRFSSQRVFLGRSEKIFLSEVVLERKKTCRVPLSFFVPTVVDKQFFTLLNLAYSFESQVL